MLDPEKVKQAFIHACSGYNIEHLGIIGGLIDKLKTMSITGFFSKTSSDEIYNYIYKDKRIQSKLLDITYEVMYGLRAYGIKMEEVIEVYDHYVDYYKGSDLDEEIKKMVCSDDECDVLMLSLFIVRMNLELFDNALIIANNKI